MIINLQFKKKKISVILQSFGRMLTEIDKSSYVLLCIALKFQQH